MKIVDYYGCMDKPHWLSCIKSGGRSTVWFEILSKNELENEERN